VVIHSSFRLQASIVHVAISLPHQTVCVVSDRGLAPDQSSRGQDPLPRARHGHPGREGARAAVPTHFV